MAGKAPGDQGGQRSGVCQLNAAHLGRNTGIAICHIEPGKPQQNAYIERYNRTVRHEWLGQYLFADIKEVQDTATEWLWTYNNERPNMGLGGITPAQKLKRKTNGRVSSTPNPLQNRGDYHCIFGKIKVLEKELRKGCLCNSSSVEVFRGQKSRRSAALCEGYHQWRRVSASTVRRDLGVLQSAIKSALQSRTDCQAHRHFKAAKVASTGTWLTRSEAATLLAAALGFEPVLYDMATRAPLKWKRVVKPQYHLALFILIGIYTGRRKEAILSLRWPKS